MSYAPPIDLPSSSDEMDTRGTTIEIGLSRASLKKYSSPARKRILARQAVEEAARQRVSGYVEIGFGLPKFLTPPKKIRDGIKKVASVAKTLGPAVINIAAPGVGTAIANGMKTVNAVAKGDPKAIADVALAAASAATGDPDAIATMEVLKAAKDIKLNVKATATITAAKKGDPVAQAELTKINADANAGIPAAIQAKMAVDAASKGITIKKNQAAPGFFSRLFYGCPVCDCKKG